ncbi:MAG: hypothetical protein JO352_07420 [Chloroflexi bacterium]|nr:hypothetical protein [Chloroflexota bacterium]MBV9596058.1 hypothetical protein [Chloroflexota bacterium]
MWTSLATASSTCLRAGSGHCAVQTISLFGTQVTGLALALTAAIGLQAPPAEMGVIGTLNVLPFVFFGLPAGGCGWTRCSGGGY